MKRFHYVRMVVQFGLCIMPIIIFYLIANDDQSLVLICMANLYTAIFILIYINIYINW